MKKIFFVVIDGLGDEPIPEFSGKTPLEQAKTPNLDYLAKNGICGQLEVEFSGATPTSEEGHFSLFGYNPKIYKIRRGIITATGCGIKAKKGDIGLRGNFATVDKKLNIIDRRAGRIKNPEPFIKALKGIEINGIKFLIKSATEHRLGIIMRGKGLSYNISDNDPFYGKLGKKARKIRALKKTEKSVFTAKVLNKFLKKTARILESHPENKKRIKKGLPIVNYILTRGASALPKVPSFLEKYSFSACCIAGKFLYQQISKILGMDLIKIKGASGKPSTNLKGKFKAAKNALFKYDFVFLHIKATDSLAEDGNFLGKKKFIEKIDRNVKEIKNLKNILLVITSDHSTCSLLKRHCYRPCPVLIYGAGKDKVKEFSEKACRKGKLGKIKQVKLMNRVLKLYKR